jgi:hypothetical protein
MASVQSHGRGVNGFVEVGMGDIVEDAVNGGKVVLGGIEFVGEELADGSKDRKVQSSCIEEQGSNHLLDPSLFCGRDLKPHSKLYLIHVIPSQSFGVWFGLTIHCLLVHSAFLTHRHLFPSNTLIHRHLLYEVGE